MAEDKQAKRTEEKRALGAEPAPRPKVESAPKQGSSTSGGSDSKK